MNRDLLDELLAMQQRDVETRSRLLQAGNLYGVYAEDMQTVHRENAERLGELIAIHGWPGFALVGQEGCRAAWRIAQHAICTPGLQRTSLAVLTDAAHRGDAGLPMVAHLADRISASENRPQRYGTVFDWNDRGELGCDLEDPANVDARRAAMGLAPFQSDLESIRREVTAEGGRPPADYAQYKRGQRGWATRVGWLS